ncbi:hypothetical protein T484DRAFT_1752501 [Baffinella frigidus]|nr:hypothetical protein T484DRAFT_1752501 [Cryptophyta sp. CCMP2293]
MDHDKAIATRKQAHPKHQTPNTKQQAPDSKLVKSRERENAGVSGITPNSLGEMSGGLMDHEKAVATRKQANPERQTPNTKHSTPNNKRQIRNWSNRERERESKIATRKQANPQTTDSKLIKSKERDI